MEDPKGRKHNAVAVIKETEGSGVSGVIHFSQHEGESVVSIKGNLKGLPSG